MLVVISLYFGFRVSKIIINSYFVFLVMNKINYEINIEIGCLALQNLNRIVGMLWFENLELY